MVASWFGGLLVYLLSLADPLSGAPGLKHGILPRMLVTLHTHTLEGLGCSTRRRDLGLKQVYMLLA